MSTIIIAIFTILDAPNPQDTPGFEIAFGARILGVVASIAGLLKIRRAYDSQKDESFIFVCGLLIVSHLVISNSIYREGLISIAAWDIAAIFAIYALAPIRFHYQAALALTLTLGSLILWIFVAVPQLNFVASISTPIAYIAANCFGITLSLNLNRIQRQEFQHLEAEKQLRADLEKTMATRDQLFSVIAHDLRGPIGALSEIGKLLDSINPIEIRKREELTNLLCVGSRTSFELLDNLLNWALSETGGIEPKIQRLDLQNAIESNIDLLAGSASNKNIRLTTDSSQGLAIQADPKMLNTILRNLIANAIKFTRKGGEIKILQRLGEDNTVKITIEDNGIGIAPNRLGQLFNLGFDDTEDGTAGEQGSNLGLRVVSDFTKKQNGRIEVASKPNQGTKITLTFPLSPDHQGDAAARTAAFPSS